MRRFCQRVAAAWTRLDEFGHALELGQDFLDHVLPGLLAEHNRAAGLPEPMPRLASLICASAVDLAIHDAYGNLHGRPTYATYNVQFMNRDLGHYLQVAEGSGARCAGRFPEEFLTLPRRDRLPAWHLVGGLDPLEPAEIRPTTPSDGHPVALCDWIQRDGLECLKIKLRGNDAAWDYDRLVRVGLLGNRHQVRWLSADFNCTVNDPAYVNAILDRLLADQPRVYQMLLYVEQPFPYDLEANPIDVRSVSARKPLLMDESAHDWKIVRLGRSLGWSGVALKTSKTQSGAVLSLCWARAHGMPLMVQDLANPMLAQVSHVQLAAHAGTIMGVETNSSQFFPAASQPESQVHPGLYRRSAGQVDLSTVGPTGFGYRVGEIRRALPEPAASFG
jgi:L-alanine-DL-glutamate epimerase-like enolase superfamily enzyme